MPKDPSFSKKLLSWYCQNARDLPWRHARDPYKIWISEIMLQQTTVNAVIPYYQRWVKIFPDVQRVARSPIQKILKIWQGLGYYSRARNIHRCAQMIVKEFGGQIPQDPHVLKKLPGFGPYTVGAVLSIAFDKRQPIIDANVRRVVMRQLALTGTNRSANEKKILMFLDKVMPIAGNNIFNQALMELGALVCVNRSPRCLLCPVISSCKAFKQGMQELIPPTKKKVIKSLQVAVAIIKNDGRYFIQQRGPQGLLAGLWEFPGGKIEDGETAAKAVKREVQEELGVAVSSARHLFNVMHFYTEFKVTLHVLNCAVKDFPHPGKTRRWIKPQEFRKYPMPSGSAKIVQKLLG